MKNYGAPGDSVRVTAPYAVTPGTGMMIGSLFCVATKTAASGELTDAVTEGQFDLPAVSAETAAEGAVAYWDAANSRVSFVTGAPIGTAPGGKASGATGVRVRLQSVAGAVSGAGNSEPPAYELLRSGASLVGWTLTNTSGATATMAMDAAPPFVDPFTGERRPCLKVTIPNDTGNVDLVATGLGVPNFTAGRGKLVALVHVADELGIKQIRPYVGPSGLGRNMDYTYPISNNNRFRVNGFHVIDIHPDKAAANTLLTTDELDTCRLRTNAQAAGGAFWLLGLYVPAPTSERWCVLTVDDADVSIYTRWHVELAKRGLRGTINVNWDDVGAGANFLTEAMLAEMYAYGHDITSHNRTNTPYPSTVPPTAQPSDADRLTYCTAYRYTRSKLIERGYTRSLGWHGYVQGAHDGALHDAMRAHGVRLARAANNSLNIEPFALKAQNIVSQRSMGSGSDLAAANGWLDSGRVRAQDACEMYHVIGDTAANSVTWAQTDLASHLDYGLATGWKFGSVSQWTAARGLVL